MIIRDSTTEGLAVVTSSRRRRSTSTLRVPEVAHHSTNSTTVARLRRLRVPFTLLHRTSRPFHPDGFPSMILTTRDGTTSRKLLAGRSGKRLVHSPQVPAAATINGDMVPTSNTSSMAMLLKGETTVMDMIITLAVTPMVTATLTATEARRRRRRGRAAPAACSSGQPVVLQWVQSAGR